ncbi:MAG: aromatic ring-hydroxylating dioxygenase subunit alpha [Gammaproteobacteria bacterium]|nr:aromatic ring-hydroxylating dioxygenase subunit alpha [Gammaproteobacteria bacterium]
MTSELSACLPNRDLQPLPRDIRKTGLDPNFWYPVARSTEVKPGKASAARFAGEPIVLVRGKGGRVFALEDRCAHRQIPLHVGEVLEDGIKCGYHGWTYNDRGDCVNIPYFDQGGLRANKIRAYPCREAYGLIFIFPGDVTRADTTRFPDIPSASDKRYKTRYLNRQVDCHYTFMHENLMDMNHQFLHRRLMGGMKTIFLGMRSGPNWVDADYTFKRNSGKQPLGEKFMLGKRPEAVEGERDLMTIRTEYPYQTLKFWTAGSTEPALDLWNSYIPRDRAQRTNHTYGLMMIRRPSTPGLINLLWPAIVWFTNGIFAEDRWVCELEQAAFDNQGEDRNQEIFPAIRGLRRVLVENGVPLESDA